MAPQIKITLYSNRTKPWYSDSINKLHITHIVHQINSDRRLVI